MATLRRDQAVTAAQPARALAAQAAGGLSDLRKEQWRQRLYEPLFADPETITTLQDRVAALDTWRQWANGHQLTPSQVNEMNAPGCSSTTPSTSSSRSAERCSTTQTQPPSSITSNADSSAHPDPNCPSTDNPTDQ